MSGSSPSGASHTLACAVAAVVVAVILVVVLGVGALTALIDGALPGGGCGGDGGTGGGSQQVGGQAWNAEQTENAQTIVAAVVARGLPKRAAVIAVSTAIVESRLTNVGHGDRDSLGLYQQRPSQGWGSPAEILNPVAATGVFLDHLLQIPGWVALPAGEAAQAVQRSAFPGRYGPQEGPAAALVDQFWRGPDNPTPPPAQAAGAAGVAAGMPAGALAALGCPDQGGSDVPLGPSTVDPRKLPPGFVLPTDPAQRAAVSYALAQVGKPYVWGAKGPDAFDCSGLMLAAWAAAGVPIPAGTVNQKTTGTPGSLAQVSPGDLLLIPGSLGSPDNPRHVGMYVGGGLVVDAYDDKTGVIVEPLARWQDRVVAVRHIAGPTGTGAAGPPAAAA